MQSRPAAVVTHLANRRPFIVRWMIWVEAANRSSGASETMGLWTGDDHEDIVVDGQSRFYFGAGGLVAIEPIAHGVGTDIRTQKATLAPMTPEVEMLIRGYDTRHCPVEIHRLLINPDTMAAIGTPVRRLKGTLETLSLITAEGGREGRAELTIATSARAGTRTLALKRSDATQRRRALPGGGEDRFYQYADISGAVPFKWGEE